MGVDAGFEGFERGHSASHVCVKTEITRADIWEINLKKKTKQIKLLTKVVQGGMKVLT